MRLFCCSDTHGKPPPYPGDNADYVLHAGDFYHLIGHKLSGIPPSQMFDLTNQRTNLIAWIKDCPRPIFCVRGNHDCEDPIKFFSFCDVTDTMEKLIDSEGRALWLIGLGGHGQRYYELPTKGYVDEKCAEMLDLCGLKMMNGDHSVVLTHYAASVRPDGSIRAEKGWFYDGITRLVEALKPVAVIAGHSHEYFGKQWMWNGTLFAFPGSKGGILEVELDHRIGEGPKASFGV